MKYAVVDEATKVVVNMIVWDGVTPYNPPQGTTLVNVTDTPCGMGWIEQPDGTFAPPPEDA
jgi:hypothetical protein